MPRLAALLILAPLLAAAAPPGRVQASFWFWLGEVPVGTVRVTRDGAEYRYQSTQWFSADRKPQLRSYSATLYADLTVDGVRMPAALWLLLRPEKVQCVNVLDEVTGREGGACNDDRLEDVDRGSVLGERYRARYRDGVLHELEVGEARFTRGDGAPPPPPDLFAAGVPVHGAAEGALSLSPAQDGSPDAPPVRAIFSRERIDAMVAELRERLSPGETGACLELAEALVRRIGRRSARVVHGMVVDGARAFPHAWVRVAAYEGGLLEVDPALGVEVTAESHLAFVGDEPGRTYLGLWSGALRLVREDAAGQP